jgi:hypothetical protein
VYSAGFLTHIRKFRQTVVSKPSLRYREISGMQCRRFEHTETARQRADSLTGVGRRLG